MNVASLRYLGIGAGMTIGLAAAVIVLGAAVGMLLAVARLYAWPPIARLAECALVIRGVPLLILLIGAYSACLISAWICALRGRCPRHGALLWRLHGRVFRGAIASVPRTQWTPAAASAFVGRRSSGSSSCRRALSLGRSFSQRRLTVVKNTSLVSAIGGWELVAAGREIGERTGDLLVVYLAIAAVYFAICFPLARLATFIERRSHV